MSFKHLCHAFSLYIATASLAWGVATVTGNVQTLTSAAPASVVVRFSLQNCRVAPRIVGTSFIATTVADFVPDASGNISGSLWRNDEITCVSLNDSFYTVTVVQLQGGAQQTSKTLNVKVVSPTFDLNSAQSITSLSPSPFNPVNVITNPPAGQTISQLPGTQLIIVGQNKFFALQGNSNIEHGWELDSSDSPSRKWFFLQAPTGGAHPNYSFRLSSDDGSSQFDYFRADLAAGTWKWLATEVNANTTSTINMTDALATKPMKYIPVAGSLPTSCDPRKDFLVDGNASTAAGSLKTCNDAGNGYVAVSAAATAGVNTFIGRAGDVVAVAGDYATVAETLQNKTIDSSNNVIVTRSKYWFDAAGCIAGTPSVAQNTPASGGAAAACKQGVTNTDISIGVLDFPDAATTTATVTVRLPADYSAATSIDVTGVWLQDGSVGDPAQTAVWRNAVVCPANGATWDAAWNTGTNTNSATGAQNLLKEWSATNLTNTGCSATNKLYLLIQRLGSNGSDTFTGTARLVGIELTLVRSQ